MFKYHLVYVCMIKCVDLIPHVCQFIAITYAQGRILKPQRIFFVIKICSLQSNIPPRLFRAAVSVFAAKTKYKLCAIKKISAYL